MIGELPSARIRAFRGRLAGTAHAVGLFAAVLLWSPVASATLLLERDTDIVGEPDPFLLSYADETAFRTNSGLSSLALPLNNSSNFSAGDSTSTSPTMPWLQCPKRRRCPCSCWVS